VSWGWIAIIDGEIASAKRFGVAHGGSVAKTQIGKEILIIFLMSEGFLKSAYRFLNAKILGADAIR
jgi:hypothetical protein